MEREAVLVGIDVGTTKVTALIGEVGRDGGLTIIGKGTMATTGLKKGVVVNIEQTVHSISGAVEQAERLSGWKIDRAFIGVGGQHVESQNSRGAVAVSGHGREVSREDINRATEVARAVSIPSNREVLHVLPAAVHRRRPGRGQGPAGDERDPARGGDPHRDRLGDRGPEPDQVRRSRPG